MYEPTLKDQVNKVKFLDLFKDAGLEGVPNWKLARVALQYNFIIFLLRKDGWDIKKRQIGDGRTYAYYLAEFEESKQIGLFDDSAATGISA